MPVYSWKGLNTAGKSVTGTRDADGPKALRQTLRKEGVFITEHREVLAGGQQAKARPGASNVSVLNRQIDFKAMLERVQPQEVAAFTRQLATLIKAGIPLAESLGALAEQGDNKKLQRVLAEIRQKVNEGSSLADTLSAHPTIFPDLYTNMVRSGEAAGNLDTVLSRLADFLDAEHTLAVQGLRRAHLPDHHGGVWERSSWACLMVVVVPKITSIFQDMGKTLPWNTQLLIFMSDLIGSYWWALIALFGFSYWLYRRWSRQPKGKAVVDRVRLKLPLIGPLVRFVGVARFARTLATMLAAGVPVLAALEITKKVLNNTVLEKVVDEARDAIREGESIATPLKRSGQFPSLMVHMVAVGERSGQLEAMLENVATAYERDVEGEGLAAHHHTCPRC